MALLINNRLAVSVQELDGIMSYAALKQLSHRGQVEIAQRGCRGTLAHYFVDSLPYKYKCEVYKRMPDLKAQAAAKPFVESVEPDGDAMNFYEEFTFDDGTHLTQEKIEEYSNNAAVLNAFRAWLERSNSKHKKTSHAQVRKGEFWENAAKALDRIDEFPTTLPRNPRRLQDKFNEYVREGYASLVSGKHRNSNAAKVDTQQKRDLITALCAIPNGFDNEFIASQYNNVARQSGWDEITASTVAKYRKENGLLIDHVRYGNTRFSNDHAMQTKRTRPTGAMLLWSLDGWDAELYYQKRNAKGVMTYTNRKVLEVVLDPCCDYPIGYAIGDKEDAALIVEALRNAANHSRELFGQRYRTCQIQSDHYAIKAMTPYYAAIAKHITPARVKNAKSKPVERYFLDINDTYCKTQGNWSGHGITAGKNGQPSSEWLNLAKKNFPDEAGVIKQLEAIIAYERARKHDDYMQFWAATAEENRLPLPEETFLLHFGKDTGYTYALGGAGLQLRIEGRKHVYDSFDIRFRELSAYKRWKVLYDTSDLAHTLAVSEDGTQRFIIEEKYQQPMALAERSEGDAAELAKIGQFNAQLNLHHQVQFEQIAQNAAPLLGGRMYEELESPDAHNELAKVLITDGKGQHKTRRAEQRLITSEAEEPVAEEKSCKKKEARKPVLVEVVKENAPAGAQRVNTFDLY